MVIQFQYCDLIILQNNAVILGKEHIYFINLLGCYFSRNYFLIKELKLFLSIAKLHSTRME